MIESYTKEQRVLIVEKIIKKLNLELLLGHPIFQFMTSSLAA